MPPLALLARDWRRIRKSELDWRSRAHVSWERSKQTSNTFRMRSPLSLPAIYFELLVTDLLAAIRASTLVLSTSADPVSTNAGMGAKLSLAQSLVSVDSL